MTDTEYTSTTGKGQAISAPLAQRIWRGIDLYSVHGERIEWIAEDRCKVPSCTHSDRTYLVVFGEDGERCNCPDFSRNDLGACKHTISALIDWAKRVDFRVDRRHDSRQGAEVWDVVETRAGVDRVVGTFRYVGTAYRAKWTLESSDLGEAA